MATIRGKRLIGKVSTLGDLAERAQEDARYAKLLVIAASNLGGNFDAEDLSLAAQQRALRWLRTNANETNSEAGVVAEVNHCRDLI